MRRFRVLLALVALVACTSGCQRLEERRPPSGHSTHAAPVPAEGSAPSYRPSEGS